MRMLILVALLVVASIQQIPVALQTDEIKIIIFASGLLAGGVLATQSSLQANLLSLVLVFLLFLKSFYAHLVANWTFQQPLAESIQELRFSAYIVFFPQAIELLRRTSSRYRLHMMNLFVASLALLDIAILFVLPGGENLVIGERSYDRYVVSVVIGLVLMITLIDDERRGEQGVVLRYANVLAALLFMLFHTVAITTSRVESILALAILLYIVSARMIATRKIALVAGMVLVGGYLATTGLDWYELGGRNYVLAVELIGESMPWGFGAANDFTVRVFTGAPANFYLADYGILFYLLRYGVLGSLFVAIIVLALGHYSRTVWAQGRSLILIAALAFYVLIVPMIDYGSLNGAFLFALMMRHKLAARVPVTGNLARA